MPTYDYECTRCGHEFCVEQSIKDKPLVKCPECGGKLRKLLPRSLNLIFKGSGFYITDYGKGRAAGKAGGKPGTAKGSGKGAGAEGDRS
jgi:putative FmdB family regulatory protein